jgi:very-short-patch-repair endonuclease
MRDEQKTSRARCLRQRETDFEHRLWQVLRNRKTFGFKFRRQHPVGSYVVDFACLEARLLIEIDGYWHAFRMADDQARDRALREAGFEVVRYDVENEAIDAVSLAEMIAHEARQRIHR